MQYYSTDWDFALSRADSCGMFILTTGSQIKIFKPEVTASPVRPVTWGNDLIAMNCGLTANDQFSDYDAVSWSPTEQKQVTATAAAPTLNSQEDLTASNLSADDNMLHQTDTPTNRAALKAWADSLALKAGLARYRGEVRFYSCGRGRARLHHRTERLG